MRFTSLLAFAAVALSWQGKYSSSTDTSTSRTYNPIMAQKNILRGEIETKINSWRDTKWAGLKNLLEREQLFRDFEGRMFGITEDRETGQSQLWEVKEFKNVHAIGGGLGPVFGADSLAWGAAKKELLTLGWTSAAEEKEELFVWEIDTFTGRARQRCEVNTTDLAASPTVLDMAATANGLVVKIDVLGTISTILVKSSNGFDLSFGTGVCQVETLAQRGTTTAGAGDAAFQHAIALKEDAFAGDNYIEFENDQVFFTKDARTASNLVALPPHTGLTYHAASYDPHFDSIWLAGTSADWNFLCGYFVSALEKCTSRCAPAACFELPALDGIAVAY